MRLMALILPIAIACSPAPERKQHSKLFSTFEPDAHRCMKLDTYYSIKEGDKFELLNGYKAVIDKIYYDGCWKVKLSIFSPTGSLIDSPELESFKTYLYRNYSFQISVGGVRTYPEVEGGTSKVADIELYYCN